MSRFSLSIGRPTLADHIFGRGLGVDIILIVAGVALTGLAAQATVPILPIPLTGQTLAVLFVGSALGALRGALSLGLYVVAGALGLPIFNNGSSGFDSIQGVTGGYIVGFVLGAALTGWLAQRAWDRNFPLAFASAMAGTIVVHLAGVFWLAIVRSISLWDAVVLGSLPIAPGAILKALVVAGLIALTWRMVLRDELRQEALMRPTD